MKFKMAEGVEKGRVLVSGSNHSCSEWIYVAEGGKNVVFASTTSDRTSHFFNKVLRMSKASPPLSKHDLELQVKYSHLMFRPGGIGDKYRCTSIVIELPEMTMDALNLALLSASRPSHRTGILHGQCGILMQNALQNGLGNILTPIRGQPILRMGIEIKPKCGCRPASPFVEEGHWKKNVSAFQRHQSLKLRQQRVNARSEYDPFNLYSEHEDRMAEAVQKLIHVPQNNFRAFFLGSEGSNEGEKLLNREELSRVCENVFLSLGFGNISSILATILKREPLLAQLKRIQAMDDVDILGLKQLNFDSYALTNSSSFDLSATLDDVQQLGFDIVFKRVPNIADLKRWEHEDGVHCKNRDQIVRAIRRFLLAATAKDASIMITIDLYAPAKGCDEEITESTYPSILEDSVLTSSSGALLLYKLTLVDTDFKHVSKFQYWRDLDEALESLD